MIRDYDFVLPVGKAVRLGRVLEGVCPVCCVPLERRDDYGACTSCALGWRTDPDTPSPLTVLVNFDGYEWEAREPLRCDSVVS